MIIMTNRLPVGSRKSFVQSDTAVVTGSIGDIVSLLVSNMATSQRAVHEGMA